MKMQDKGTKAAWLASLGAGLEYYDFIIYGMMAGYLGPLFFPTEESWVGLLRVFGIFAVGYLIRPFGGILFGMIGDVYGRKHTFLAVMSLMAFSTFAIGLLPTYDQIGVGSSVFLIFMRILQGLSFGAELPGAITVVCEYSSHNKQGSYIGYVISSTSLGSALASLALYFLTQNSSQAQIMDGGWRIPFLLGGILAFANYFIRKHLGETPEFSHLQSTQPNTSIKDPLTTLGQDYRKEIALGIGMTWFHSSLVIFCLYFPVFLSQHFGYSSAEIYLAIIFGMIGSSISLLFTGILSDWLGKKTMLLGTCIAFAGLGFTLFKIAEMQTQIALVIFMILYQMVISCLVVSYLPLLAGLFPTRIRYTGIAACYNITYSFMGCLPMIVTFLIQTFETPYAGIGFLLASALVTAISSAFVLKQSQYSVSNSAPYSL
jgi:MFS family permease